MNLLDITDKDCITSDLKAKDKEGIIIELVGLLDKAGKIKDKKKAVESINQREQKGSTGLEKGIAVPHAKADIVDKLVMAAGISRKGVDFNAMDGEDSYIFFLLLSPLDTAGPHIEALALIAKLIALPAIREKLRTSLSSEEIINIISRYEKNR